MHEITQTQKYLLSCLCFEYVLGFTEKEMVYALCINRKCALILREENVIPSCPWNSHRTFSSVGILSQEWSIVVSVSICQCWNYQKIKMKVESFWLRHQIAPLNFSASLLIRVTFISSWKVLETLIADHSADSSQLQTPKYVLCNYPVLFM